MKREFQIITHCGDCSNTMGAHKSQSKKTNVLKLEPGKNQQTADQAKEIASLRTELTHLSNRLADLEALVQQADPEQIKTTATKLREELIAGLRALGERVSKAIQEMEKRFETFRNEISHKDGEGGPVATGEVCEHESVSAAEETVEGELAPADDSHDEPMVAAPVPFGELREPSLLAEGHYEIISKGNIAQLAELFRKQSEAIRRISELHQQKFTFFEHQMDAHEKIIDDRVQRAERKVNLLLWVIISGLLALTCWIAVMHYL